MSTKEKNHTEDRGAVDSLTSGKAASKGAAKESEDEEESEEEPVKKPAAKKPVAKTAAKKPASDEEEEDEEEDDDEEDDVPAAKKPPAKSATKANPKKNESEEEDDDEEEEEDDDDEDDKKKPAAKAAKPAAKKVSDDEEDDDDDEEESDEEPVAKASGKAAAKASAKPATKPAGKAAGKAAAKAAAKKGDDFEDILAEFDAAGDKQMSQAQLKRQRKAADKKTKENEPKSEEKPKDTKPEAKPAAKASDGKSEPAAKKGAEKKPRKGLEHLKAKLQADREEESRAIEALAAAKSAAEAEAKRLEEEEKRREEEKQRKSEEKKRAREELRKAGKLVSKAQKKEKEKDQAFLDSLKAQGMTIPGLQKKTGDEDDKDKTAEKSDRKKDKGKAKKAPAKKNTTHLEAERIRAAAAAEEKAKKEEPEEQLERELDLSVVSDDSESEEDVVAPVVTTKKAPKTKDSWDDDSDDESSSSAAAPAASAVSAGPSARKIESMTRRAARADKRAKNKEIAAQNTQIRQRNEQRLKKRQEAKRKAEQEKKAKEDAEKEAALSSEASDSKDSAVAADPKKYHGGGGALRSPICVVMGHVDAGKTKILDNLRHTNVGMKEAGGITQQIGATYVPMLNIEERTKDIRSPERNIPIPSSLKKDLEIRYPGLLIIDTPGHESFTNLRSRGSSLCDIAVLVVDIKSGIQRQTDESIEMLKEKKTPFIIALNKIDRMYGWQPNKDAPFLETLAKQKEDAQAEFKACAKDIQLQFNKRGHNCFLYYENPSMNKNLSMIPVSAATGEGMPDLLLTLTNLTQINLDKKLQYGSSLKCVVLEVKVVEGMGTTLDVILVNGVLHEGDTILVCGLNGPITTNIRSLLTPAPMTEMRVKTDYQHHKEVRAAMGVKIQAHGLEGAIAGSQLIVVHPKDDIEELKNEVMADLQTILAKVGKTPQGIYVQASTLGSMEAMLNFLDGKKIPVAGIALGPVYKHNIMKAAVQLEHRMEYATILAFDVKVTPEAAQEADHQGVKILESDVIYTLFDGCTKYFEQIRQMRREETKDEVVFPVVLKIMEEHIYRIKNPIVLGCRVVDGTLRLNTPIVVPQKQNLFVGRVMSIQKNHEDLQVAKKDDEVAVKIGVGGIQQTHMVQFGRHFTAENDLVSRLTRESIDLLKQNYKDDVSDDDWRCVIRIKKFLGIS